jgi:hypothetical protein
MEEEMGEKGVLLTDLKARQCRFVLRDGRSPARFCGEPTLGAGSWCLEHRRIVFVASSQKELSLRRGTQTAASSEVNALARLVADGVITNFSTSFGRPASELDLHCSSLQCDHLQMRKLGPYAFGSRALWRLRSR